jgi:hypothetical protein
MGGAPLEVSRLNLILVHLPATHFMVVLRKKLVKSVDI